jgi:hypothetical protein
MVPRHDADTYPWFLVWKRVALACELAYYLAIVSPRNAVQGIFHGTKQLRGIRTGYVVNGRSGL